MNIPKYRYIMQEIQGRVHSGKYPSGKALPSERALAKEFSTNHETANKAISHLVAEGLLYRKRGIGTFIREADRVMESQNYTIDILLYKKATDLFQAASYHEELLFSLQQTIVLKGYACRIIPVLDLKDFSTQIREPKAVIISNYLPYKYISEIHEAGIPIVALNFGLSSPWISSVNIDNRALDLLCHHLVELGHKKIGFLRRGGFVYSHDLKEIRFKSFMQMMELHENLNNIFVLDTEEDSLEGKLVSEVRNCTAIVVADDFLAIKMQQLLKKYRIGIPRDISITGFGNLSLSKILFPALTTADVDRESLCLTLAEEALRRAEGESEGRDILFPSFPVIRESTSKPKA